MSHEIRIACADERERERERVDFHDSLNPLLESVCNLQINHTRQK